MKNVGIITDPLKSKNLSTHKIRQSRFACEKIDHSKEENTDTNTEKPARKKNKKRRQR